MKQALGKNQWMDLTPKKKPPKKQKQTDKEAYICCYFNIPSEKFSWKKSITNQLKASKSFIRIIPFFDVFITYYKNVTLFCH